MGADIAKGHFKELLASMSTNATYELSAGVSAVSAPSATKGGEIVTRDRTGVNLWFCGTGVDNSTFRARVYARKRVHPVGEGDPGNGRPSLYHRQLICTVDGVLASGIALPTTGNVFPASTIGCDTLTLTIDSGWTHLVNTLGGGTANPAVFSPGLNTDLALLTIPDVFDAECVEIDFDIDAAGGTAATGINGAAETVR